MRLLLLRKGCTKLNQSNKIKNFISNLLCFIIYKVMKYRKILMKYTSENINFIFSLHRSVHITILDYL